MPVGGADDESREVPVTEMVEQPAKVMRIGSMIKQLLEEVRAAPLDEASRVRLKDIHAASVKELEDGLAPELVEELERLSLPFTEEAIPSEAELRIAQAQLVGWLEGLFHGIQTALFAQQMAARAQLEQMRRALPRAPRRTRKTPTAPSARARTCKRRRRRGLRAPPLSFPAPPHHPARLNAAPHRGHGPRILMGMTYDAIVLAGGAARRLGGADKPALHVGGRALIDRVLDACTDAATTVVVGGRRPTSRPVRWTREDPPGAGPVAALDAGLRQTTAELVLVLSADLPFLDRATVRALLRAPAPGGDGALLRDPTGRDQPLVAAYRAEPCAASSPSWRPSTAASPGSPCAPSPPSWIWPR